MTPNDTIAMSTHPDAKSREQREHDARFWFHHPIGRNRSAIVDGNGFTVVASMHSLTARLVVRQHNDRAE